IMNASLVQVGLDLLEWPNLNFWQLNDDINAVRQAGRRAWRIGRQKNVLCVILSTKIRIK
ncbi:hypothetical protein, partial [Paenibacillus tundrae]|uniref:hypothetical protein n=1 Tax=Paenibacillus tundrae TaxID=528187 RepID=UPI0022A9C06E